MAKRGLGKGLDALFQDNSSDESAVSMLKLTQLEPNKSQPRSSFDEEALRELADSILIYGVISPLVVRPLENGAYQIVAGERRWRASRMAGLSEVPVIIRELSDSQTLEIAIIENLQREDLNAVELAYGYNTLMEKYDMTQEEIAAKLGKSRSVIANTVRLLGLPEKVLDYVRDGKITQGHARALLAIDDESQIIAAAERAAAGNLLVREIEWQAKTKKQPRKAKEEAGEPAPFWGREPSGEENFRKEIELALEAELGRKVRIKKQGKKLILEVELYSDTDLSDLAGELAGRLGRDRNNS
ncbi:MAG: ParB/RepB/Spo0J family partition protein [Oscillospiraceae bacterium]|nr:ParB/RepB/Spo0J family partition protein [Oscillospiraceae bacterium]